VKPGRAAVPLGFLVWVAVGAFAASEENQDARAFFKRALQAHEQKDYAGFVENMEAALKLRPNHQVYMYDLAAGYSLAGKKEQAIALLSRAAALGFVFPEIQKDADFSSLRGQDDFEAVLKKFAENRTPVTHSELAFTVHEKGLVPEGLAYDPNTKTFFLGSVYRRKIVAVNAANEARNFSRNFDGLWSVMGMKVDATRRLLWGCTAGHMQMANAKLEDDGKTALFKYDLSSGKLLKKYRVSDDGRKHWLGDLLLDSRGDVYASDSLSPAIYVIRQDKDEIELLVAGSPFINPQGIVLAPDEKKLVMADYLKGLFLIDLQTKKVQEIAAPANVTLLGIDGIYRVGHDIIGVQNGITPNRVVRMKLSDDYDKVEKLEVLEANNAVFDEPTLGVVVGDRFYFIANSQWDAIDAKGTLAPEDKLRDPIILRLNL
jgi:tetratricopeptide (TPR) repeat protein